MNRIVTAFALALSLAAATTTALAAPPKGDRAGRHEKHQIDEKKFPMKADEFRASVTQRLTKAQERMEKHLQEKKVEADKAKAAREQFAAGAARVKAKVDEVAADGTVTLDEAKAVRTVMHDNLKKGHGGKKHEKKA